MLDGIGVKDNKNGRKKLFICGSLSSLAESTCGPSIASQADTVCVVQGSHPTAQLCPPEAGAAAAAEQPQEIVKKKKRGLFFGATCVCSAPLWDKAAGNATTEQPNPFSGAAEAAAQPPQEVISQEKSACGGGFHGWGSKFLALAQFPSI